MTSHWEQYLKLSEEFRPEQVSALALTLDQIWSTPEGKERILRAHKIRGSVELNEGDDNRVIIAPEKYHRYDISQNAVHINLEALPTQYYLATDGTSQPYSLLHILFHELDHAADEYATMECYEALRQTGFSIRESISVTELPTMYATNEFIVKYAGELPRNHKHVQPHRGEEHSIIREKLLIEEPEERKNFSSEDIGLSGEDVLEAIKAMREQKIQDAACIPLSAEIPVKVQSDIPQNKQSVSLGKN